MRATVMFCTLFAFAFGFPVDAAADPVVLTNATIVDIEAGTTRPRQIISLRNGRIERIADTGDKSDNDEARVIDLGGNYVLPGLWDMHLHPDGESDLEQLIANGVTAGRVMAGEPEHLAWRASIELGELTGPHLYIAGPIIEGRPPPEMAAVIVTENRRLLSNRAEAVAEARMQKAAGFDYLKVYNNLPAEAYAGLISEGGRLGLPVVGHVPFEVGLRGALEARQASIEHLRGFIQLLIPAKAPVQPGADYRSRTLAWEYADLDKLPPVVEATLAAGVWITPTLSTQIYTSPAEEVARYLASPVAAYIGRRDRAVFEDRSRIKWLSNFTEEDWQRASRGHAKRDAVVLALQRAGVPLLAGTDMEPYGFTLHGELERLVNAGLTPREALLTATRNAAEFVGEAERSGKIAEGYRADLLVLDANPLEDIRHTRRIFAVVARGKVFDRAALDEMLACLKVRIADADSRRN